MLLGICIFLSYGIRYYYYYLLKILFFVKLLFSRYQIMTVYFAEY